jgi:hypothetical protein
VGVTSLVLERRLYYLVQDRHESCQDATMLPDETVLLDSAESSTPAEDIEATPRIS